MGSPKVGDLGERWTPGDTPGVEFRLADHWPPLAAAPALGPVVKGVHERVKDELEKIHPRPDVSPEAEEALRLMRNGVPPALANWEAGAHGSETGAMAAWVKSRPAMLEKARRIVEEQDAAARLAERRKKHEQSLQEKKPSPQGGLF